MVERTYSTKPYMKKTIVKFVLIFVAWALILSPLFLMLEAISSYSEAENASLLPFVQSSTIIPYLGLIAFSLYSLLASVFFVIYYYNKRGYVFSITDKSVRIQKSWIFGTYEREITLDQIRDVQINQGLLARFFNCGSLRFATASGLEVGYSHVGTGAGINVGGFLVGGGTATSTPTLLKGRGNTFWDIQNPSFLRQELIAKLSEWREVVQEQKMATSLEEIRVREAPLNSKSVPSVSFVCDLEKLSELFEKGTLTKEEYKKAKDKLLDIEN